MAVSSAEADLVFAGGKIRTPAHPSGFVQALAVRDGVIQAVGSDDEIRELTGRRTRVIDLRGRLALPAFGDAHVHAVSGGLESLRCNLLGLRTRHECLEVVANYSSARPSGGPGCSAAAGPWRAFPAGCRRRRTCTSSTGGRPAFLPNRDHHSAWVNTAALKMAGIDASTPDPVDGRIERDEVSLADGHAARRGHAPGRGPRAAAGGGRAHRGPPRGPIPTCTRSASPGSRTPAWARPASTRRHAGRVRRLPAGRRLRHAQLPGGRRPVVVGQAARPRPDRRPAGAARAGQRRPVQGDHGQADARRRMRDVHRRDVRPVPGPARTSRLPTRAACSSIQKR